MLEIPQSVVQILSRGLSAETTRQLAIADEVGDDWPDWFDRNDATIYNNYRNWLLEHPSNQPVIEDKVNSKPVQFVMELLPQFVAEQRADLTDSEAADALRVYASYVALYCRRWFKIEEVFLDENHPLQEALTKLIDFPK